MATYTSIEGDMVDMICRRIYGDESGFTEKVYAANLGLADRGLVLPAGVVIQIPALTSVENLSAVSLWE